MTKLDGDWFVDSEEDASYYITEKMNYKIIPSYDSPGYYLVYYINYNLSTRQKNYKIFENLCEVCEYCMA